MSVTDPSDPLVGKLLKDNYRIVRKLGEGGMGCVYEGHQKLGDTTRRVAVKTLHTHLSHDPKIRARFDREVGTVAKLNHPNTIQVFDFGTTDDGILFIVMEFVEGKSVADLLEKDGPMGPPRVLNILRQVVGSLDEAHKLGIIHRDLKPDNVVLCDRAGEKDWVEVLDFGIAKRSSDEDKEEKKLTQQGMVLGTPPYMSPEQFTGMPIDARSDIYSLGVMVYEMLTGRLPFSGNTAWEWASAHMTAPPAPIEQQPLGDRVPPAMKAAILKALEKLPQDRFAGVRDFYEACQGTGAPAAYVPPSSPTPGGARSGTQVGTPLDIPPGAFAPHTGAVMAAPNAAVGAAPTPDLAPLAPPMNAPPARTSSGGGGRGMIFGIAAVIGVLSIIAIVFALKGRKPKPAGNDLSSLSASDTSAATDTATAGADAAAPVASGTGGGEPLPDLTGPAGSGKRPLSTRPAGSGKPPGTATASTGKPSGSSTTPPPPTTTTPPPPPPPTTTTPPPPPPPAADPQSCKDARALRAKGDTGFAFQLAASQCQKHGGKL